MSCHKRLDSVRQCDKGRRWVLLSLRAQRLSPPLSRVSASGARSSASFASTAAPATRGEQKWCMRPSVCLRSSRSISPTMPVIGTSVGVAVSQHLSFTWARV